LISAGAVPQTRWGRLSASPCPLAIIKGPTSKGRGMEEGKRWEEEKRDRMGGTLWEKEEEFPISSILTVTNDPHFQKPSFLNAL